MRNAIVRLPEQGSAVQQLTVLRTAVRQLERADMYLAAVAAMDFREPELQHAVDRLRRDLEGLRRSFIELRSELIS